MNSDPYTPPPSSTTSTLPQLDERLFLTDGGIETTLVFQDGFDLPHFAAIDMLRKDGGSDHLRAYFERYIAIARETGAGFILESTTWRASPDWAEPLGLSQDGLDALNRDAIALLHEIRRDHASDALPILVSGCIGPRGDGYRPETIMLADEAERYHAHQIGVFAESGVDMISAITMTNVPEAIGITRAARRQGLPAVISFTVETDGRLPTGDSLRDAIEMVDDRSEAAPLHYMINCAHPTHFAATLAEDGAWSRRIRGLRANASCLSHAELDAATELDSGDPARFGREHHALFARHPSISIVGGCCGTDHRHVAAIAAAVAPLRPSYGTGPTALG